MLRQVFITFNEKILYSRNYGKAIDKTILNTLLPELKNSLFKSGKGDVVLYSYFKYKISSIAEVDKELLFILITGLLDDENRIKTQIFRLKKEFLSLFGESIKNVVDSSLFDVLNPFIDGIHRNLKPKISIVGFSGVGKTTITKLIKAEKIPIEHIPTITGDRATIKIGKLEFNFWDFAGQEQFSFLWNKFIKGSDAVLLITDSTIENVEKSKFFLELIKDEVPYAYSAVIGNKQDLPKALSVSDIERHLGLKTYAMIAIDPINRSKMIRIIADILEMSTELSPLLKPLFEREELIDRAQKALERDALNQVPKHFQKIADLCIQLGDDALGKEFFEKSIQIKSFLS